MKFDHSVHGQSHQALVTHRPEEKIALTESLFRRWKEGEISLETNEPVVRIDNPGHPDNLSLVHPKELEKRRLSTLQGKQVFVHAIAHIEFNAINLALDAVYRFRGMESSFYTDWLSVAVEEANHHRLLANRLVELGCEYGDFPAHNGLWDMAMKTDHDLLQRMALIPCVFEARGLDVTPPMIQRMVALGDEATAEILRLILREEVRHVAVGQRWFKHECERRKLDPENKLIELIETHLPGRKHGPFNFEARIAAGFTESQLIRLGQIQRDQ